MNYKAHHHRNNDNINTNVIHNTDNNIDETMVNDPFEQMRLFFKKGIEKYYDEGYSIILGGEAIDTVLDPTLSTTSTTTTSSSSSSSSSTTTTSDSTLLDAIHTTLPQIVIDHKDKLLSTLISYRAPRVDHFKSYWKMTLDKSTSSSSNQQQQTNTTVNSAIFTKHICDNLQTTSSLSSSSSSSNNNNLNHKSNIKYYAIDSLALAVHFLQKGWNVKLLDMSGVMAHRRVDFFSALGCDIMNLKCEIKRFNKKTQKIPLAFLQNAFGTQIANAMTMPKNRRDYGNLLSKIQNRKIDKYIRHYDCAQYRLLMEHYDGAQLDILYGSKLKELMEECTTKFSADLPTLQETIQRIGGVLKCKFWENTSI